MARPAPDLRAYLGAVVGGSVSPFRRLTLIEKKLSLALRGRYRLESVRLFDHELVLAVESTGLQSATPAAYRAHSAAIAPSVKAPLVLVLTGITSTTRARLVAARVPFIVPGKQLFLPMLLVDLRERMNRLVASREGTLGNVAQLVILAHLQGHRMDILSLADAASRFGYSPMMLTKAKNELVAAGLCTVRAEGRALRLSFAAEGRALWEMALPRLSSPIVRTQLLRYPATTKPPVGFVLAGVSALSDLTNLADDDLATYALSKSVAATAGARFQRVDFEEDASARLEIWRRAPKLLTTDDRVDALSLFLSLRNNPDERVQEALSDLIESIRW